MGRVGHELAQAVLGRLALREGSLDLVEHAVERQAQATDLGVRRDRTSTRRDRSPSAMALAVAAISSIGCTPRRITQKAIRASATSTAAVDPTATAVSRLKVALVSRQRHPDHQVAGWPAARRTAATR